MADVSHPAIQRQALWQQRLRRYQSVAGKQSVAAFCKEQRCSEAMFYYWRKELGPANNRQSSADAKQGQRQSSVFRAVAVKVSPSVSIDLPNGVRLRLPGDNSSFICDVAERLAGLAFPSEE